MHTAGSHLHLSVCAVSLAKTLLPTHQRTSGVVSFQWNLLGKYLSLLSSEGPEPDPFSWGSVLTFEMFFLIQSEVSIVLTWPLPAHFSASRSHKSTPRLLGLRDQESGPGWESLLCGREQATEALWPWGSRYAMEGPRLTFPKRGTSPSWSMRQPQMAEASGL